MSGFRQESSLLARRCLSASEGRSRGGGGAGNRAALTVSAGKFVALWKYTQPSSHTTELSVSSPWSGVSLSRFTAAAAADVYTRGRKKKKKKKFLAETSWMPPVGGQAGEF